MTRSGQKRTGKIPPFMVRRIVWFIVITSILSLVGTVVVLLLRGRLSPSIHVLLLIVPILATLPITLGFIQWSRAIGRRAFDNNGRMCWKCGYVLSGLAQEGRCPECGIDYTFEELRAHWRMTRLGPPIGDAADDAHPAGATPAHQRYPRFMKRRAVVFGLVMVVIPVASIGACFAGLFGPPTRALPFVVIAQLVLAMGFTVWFLASFYALVRRLHATRNRLCFGCGYDVSSLGEQGRCPECGDEFEHADLRTKWLEISYIPAATAPAQNIDTQNRMGR